MNTRNKHSTKYYYLNASVAEIFWNTVGSALWKFIPSNGRNDPIAVIIFGGIGAVTLLLTSPVWAPFVGAYAIGKKISNNQEKSQLEIEWDEEEKVQSIADMAAREKRLKSMPVPPKLSFVESTDLVNNSRPHEKIEWHVDEGGRHYYISDDLISDDDNDDEAARDNPGISFSDSARPSQTLIDAIEAQEDVEVQYDESRDLYYMESAGDMVSIKDMKADVASVTNQGIFSPGMKLKNQTTAEPRSIEEDAKTAKPERKI